MATVWGRAEIIVTADGKGLPAQVKKMAIGAGELGGSEFAKSFDKALTSGINQSMKELGANARSGGKWERLFYTGGENMGNALTRGFRKGIKGISSGSNAITDLRTSTARLTDGFRQLEIEGSKAAAIWEPMIEDIGELHQVFDDATDSANRFSGHGGGGGGGGLLALGDEADDSSRKVKRFGGSLGKIGKWLAGNNFFNLNKELKKNGNLWQNLSHNTRQWTLIIGAVIGSIGQLATLSSAAGAGIFVLAGALGVLTVGLGVAIGGFVTFLGDIKKLPKALLPARKAFDALGDSFKDLGEKLAVSIFKDTEDAWKSLSKTVRALTPALKTVGAAVGRVIQRFAKFFEADSEGFEDLENFIRFSAGAFEGLMTVVGKFGEAILNIFANKFFQTAVTNMITGLGKLGDKFIEFTESPALNLWFSRATRIFTALGGLLATTADVLNDLVTTESTNKLIDFLDNIAGFMDGGGRDILNFAEELDIFGVVAKALKDFGDALEPLAGPMEDFASALNDVFNTAIDTLAPILEDVAEALAPFVQGIADFMDENPQAFANALTAIAVAFVAIKAVGIVANILPGIASIVTLAGPGNTTKISKFAAAIAGLAAVLAGGFTTANTEESGPVASGGILASILGGATVGSVFGPIGILIGAVGGLISNAVISMFSEQDNVWKNGWRQISDTFQGVIDNFKNGWNQIVNFFTVEIPGFFGEIGAMFTNGWNQISTGWRNFWTGIVNGWNKFWGDVNTNIRNAVITLLSIFTNLWNRVRSGWVNFWGGLPRAVENAWTTIWREIGNWGRDIKTKLTGWVTEATSNWNAFWGGLPGAVQDAVSGVLGWVNDLTQPIQDAISQVQTFLGLNSKARDRKGGGSFASGGILMGPRRILAGEAGPEAIVPMNRPLGQVDPSVRWLSAIAQGRSMPQMASGGVVGPGRTINVEPGAIVVNNQTDPRRAAQEVVNRLAEKAVA